METDKWFFKKGAKAVVNKSPEAKQTSQTQAEQKGRIVKIWKNEHQPIKTSHDQRGN